MCSLQIFQMWQGHDVVAIACPERYVVGLDVSDKAIKKAEEVREACRHFIFLSYILNKEAMEMDYLPFCLPFLGYICVHKLL